VLKGFAKVPIAVDVSMPQRSAQVHLPFSGDNNGGIDLDWVKKKLLPPSLHTAMG